MIDCPLNRLKVKRGSALPQSKLSEADVIAIRRQHERAKRLISKIQSRYTAKNIAKHYGVHARTVEKILSFESWTHA